MAAGGSDADPTFRLTADGKVYRRGQKKYANLDIYDGEFLDNMRHGQGVLRVFCGDRYEGEWERNLFHGQGVYTYTAFADEGGDYITGKRYEGGWKDGKFHGRGVYILGDGTVYSGEFERGLYHGKGTLKTKSDDTYTGVFARGKPAGKMRVTFANGDLYDGEMRSGKFQGKGKFEYANGKGIYEGEWERGLANGQGMRVYSNGTRYVGQFLDGEANGQGVMFYSNGDQYIGQFVRGSLCGRGVMKYSRGDMYEGSFLHGVFYGEGKFTWSDGSYYEGQYRYTKTNKITEAHVPVANGKRHGFGLRVFANGAKYKGAWTNDKMDGAGELIQADGARFEGVFTNGLKHGYGIETIGNLLAINYICPMGHRHKGIGFCRYEGDYKKGFFHGQGTYRCLDGREYKGFFADGKRNGFGRQEYLREGDKGDLARQCIGGRHSMYRVDFYEGNWVDNERHGAGTVTYINGDTVSGNFVNGTVDGFAEYTFVSGGKRRRRMVRYVRGERKEWMAAGAKAAKEASSFLIKLRGQIATEAEYNRQVERDNLASRGTSRGSSR
jgi:hypothetical protein